MDFESDTKTYKSLTPSQFEEHVKTLNDSNNNNKSGSSKEFDVNEKYRVVQRN